MNIQEYISSGILEQYVLGTISAEEALEVEKLAVAHAEIRNELNSIGNTFEQMAMANAVAPSQNTKPFLIATIDYMERIENGETVTNPPLLNETAGLIDFATWLERDDMFLPADAPDLYAKIIGYSPESVTAIVWIKNATTPEVHIKEIEKFLIVEGTCDIIVEEEIHQLVPGDYFDIPLHKNHIVKVTSHIPCKVILQRSEA